jgi:hypothetical protein
MTSMFAGMPLRSLVSLIKEIFTEEMLEEALKILNS